MTTDQIKKTIAEQMDTVITAAREHFSDTLEEHLAAKGVALTLDDKGAIESMFTGAVRSLLIAELPAFVAWVAYNDAGGPDSLLTGSVPGLLDEYEARMDQAPKRLADKTSGLTDAGKNAVQAMASAKDKKSELVQALYKDLAGMDQMKHLRASYDAVLLSLLGE